MEKLGRIELDRMMINDLSETISSDFPQDVMAEICIVIRDRFIESGKICGHSEVERLATKAYYEVMEKGVSEIPIIIDESFEEIPFEDYPDPLWDDFRKKQFEDYLVQTSQKHGEVIVSYRNYCEIKKFNDWRDYNRAHILWAEAVKARDGRKCQRRGCGSKERVHAHHRNNAADFRDLRLDVNNGVTLCENCHIEFHKTYGYHGTTAEDTDEFIQTPYNM